MILLLLNLISCSAVATLRANEPYDLIPVNQGSFGVVIGNDGTLELGPKGTPVVFGSKIEEERTSEGGGADVMYVGSKPMCLKGKSLGVCSNGEVPTPLRPKWKNVGYRIKFLTKKYFLGFETCLTLNSNSKLLMEPCGSKLQEQEWLFVPKSNNKEAPQNKPDESSNGSYNPNRPSSPTSSISQPGSPTSNTSQPGYNPNHIGWNFSPSSSNGYFNGNGYNKGTGNCSTNNNNYNNNNYSYNNNNNHNSQAQLSYNNTNQSNCCQQQLNKPNTQVSFTDGLVGCSTAYSSNPSYQPVQTGLIHQNSCESQPCCQNTLSTASQDSSNIIIPTAPPLSLIQDCNTSLYPNLNLATC